MIKLKFTKKAKAVCERCPVQYNCLEGALESNEQNGIWGGHTEDERKFIIDEWRDLNSITTNTNEAATQNLYAGIMSIVKIDKAPYKKD